MTAATAASKFHTRTRSRSRFRADRNRPRTSRGSHRRFCSSSHPQDQPGSSDAAARSRPAEPKHCSPTTRTHTHHRHTRTHSTNTSHSVPSHSLMMMSIPTPDCLETRSGRRSESGRMPGQASNYRRLTKRCRCRRTTPRTKQKAIPCSPEHRPPGRGESTAANASLPPVYSEPTIAVETPTTEPAPMKTQTSQGTPAHAGPTALTPTRLRSLRSPQPPAIPSSCEAPQDARPPHPQSLHTSAPPNHTKTTYTTPSAAAFQTTSPAAQTHQTRDRDRAPQATQPTPAQKPQQPATDPTATAPHRPNPPPATRPHEPATPHPPPTS
jgi:hypothetical protein